MARLISRTELARIAGVTQAAITKATKKDLAEACVGVRIDASHPSVATYLERRGIKLPPELAEPSDDGQPSTRKRRQGAPGAPPSSRKAQETGSSAPPAVNPEKPAKGPVRLVSREVKDISEVADMTVRQIVAKFGTITQFKDWLEALRKIEDIREKNLRNAETDGNLISIRLVQTHVMGAIERGFRRLLTDAPKSIARTLFAAAKSGATLEEGEQIVREIISAQLRPLKDGAARMLRGSADELQKTA